LHPEISDEKLAKIQHQLPNAALTITAESWIRMICDQRRELATPPRYAALAARYLQAIRELHSDGPSRHVAEIRGAFINEGSGLLLPPDDDDDDEGNDEGNGLLMPDGNNSDNDTDLDNETATAEPPAVADLSEPWTTYTWAKPRVQAVDTAAGAPPLEPDSAAAKTTLSHQTDGPDAPADALSQAITSPPQTDEDLPPRTDSLEAQTDEERDPDMHAASSAAAAPGNSGQPSKVSPEPEVAPQNLANEAAEPQAPIIPTLLASSAPRPTSAPQPAAAPLTVPRPTSASKPAAAPEEPTTPTRDRPPSRPELAAENSTTLPTLRRSQVDAAVIPDLQRRTATTEPPSPTRDSEPIASPPAALLPALTDRPSTPTPGASAIIPTLQRPATTEPTREPNAPPQGSRRKRSSGYVPATLVHRQAKAPTSLDTLLQSAIDAGGSDAALTTRIQETGEQAFVRIAQLFPGPIALPHSDLNNLPTASAHGPLLRLCIALGPPITPFVLARIGDPDANVRFYVALVFQELRAPEAIGPLARLAFDDDRDVRTIAMRVLETYHDDPSYTRAVQALRRELTGPDPTRRQRAIQAMGMLRDIGSLDKLTEALSDDLETSAAALRALCTISGQHLGMSRDAWNTWLQDNRDRSR
ncbi:MAG TPA: hypothetical protein ENK31_01885, partial [Nannocystis exedens]|nr:hypothetical protein [Nannocystis exedens]